MTEIDIHGFKVKYDENSNTLQNAVRYLSEKIDKDEAKVFFNDARRDLRNHSAHLEVRNREMNRDDNLTLIHDGGNNYHLRKREHRIF